MAKGEDVCENSQALCSDLCLGHFRKVPDAAGGDDGDGNGWGCEWR